MTTFFIESFICASVCVLRYNFYFAFLLLCLHATSQYRDCHYIAPSPVQSRSTPLFCYIVKVLSFRYFFLLFCFFHLNTLYRQLTLANCVWRHPNLLTSYISSTYVKIDRFLQIVRVVSVFLLSCHL